MRAYFFGNFYLSSIQQGIQGLHAFAEMMTKYRFDEKVTFIYDWIDNHKTAIFLNGGDSFSLIDLQKNFAHKENPYPWAIFNESTDALNGALTSISIVLPSKIYEGAQYLRMAGIDSSICFDEQKGNIYTISDGIVFDEMYTPYEIFLMKLLTKYSLAH